MSGSGIRIRAMRQLALLCAAPLLGGANTVLAIRQSPIYGLREFADRDSIFVYYEGDDATRLDDGWVKGRINSRVSGFCPDASPAWLLSTSLAFTGTQVATTGNILSGSPVRGFEHVTYQLHSSDGRQYIGMQVGSGTIQPLIGPLTPTNGLTFAYFDSTGAPTATRNRVAMIRMTLRAETRQAFRQLDGSIARSVDSVTTWVALRNNARY